MILEPNKKNKRTSMGNELNALLEKSSKLEKVQKSDTFSLKNPSSQNF